MPKILVVMEKGEVRVVSDTPWLKVLTVDLDTDGIDEKALTEIKLFDQDPADWTKKRALIEQQKVELNNLLVERVFETALG